ncbi:Beta-barrel assembly machine subunit BamA [Stigmatella aurantiaca]|uniref:Beta-barrel assembly machine subunit BamA n=1 Tax=Stigmatella aurantiaca TaxID=41 RepID=A0A1H7X3Y7_STIAU|nr:BamA/TamA family outer membrane protein [Stigmatella aurantiaca]SEM28294.1 Beta-barrel assembly machine subunit BamA [Stigmatella aurantiaca]
MEAARPHFRFLLLAVSLLLASACAGKKPRPDALKVDDLEIEGTKQVSEGSIKSKILTTDTPWWEPLWPFDKGPSYFDPIAWEADRRRIERYYQSQGYYQAAITSKTEEEVKPEGKDAVKVQVTVREGEPTRIEAIHITGLEPLSEEHRKLATEALPLKEGDIFQEENWSGVKELIQGRLREVGYAEAEVTGEAQVDLATQLATVDLRVALGPRYRFGNVFISTDPNPQVSPKRIIEQAQGAIRKGAWFSESALAEAQARVFAMGVFGAVKVNRGGPDQEAVTVPVVVDVREAPMRSVRLGGGLGIDATRQEARALAEWTNRNTFGGLRRLTVRGRVGYAFLPSFYAGDDVKSGVVGDLTTEFEQPRFLFRDLRLQASVTGEKGLEQAYSFYGGRLRAGVIWQPHPNLSIFPAYNIERFRLQGRVEGNETVPPITLGCRERDSGSSGGTSCDISLSYLETTIEWDRRDDRTEPRNGYYAALSVQAGGGPLQGDFTYIRLLPDVRYYRSFGEQQRLTVAGKLRLGTLVPYRNEETGLRQSSIVNRFFSGGGSSMRGFNSRRLSPLTPLNPDDPETTTVPVGGNSLFETSLELRYRMTESLVVATFWDTGSVSTGSLSFGRNSPLNNRLYHALGLGLRYLTLVGPIRVDIARRLNIGPPLPIEPSGSTYTLPSSGTCFGLGGKKREYAGAPDGLCTIQLSIGEAF